MLPKRFGNGRVLCGNVITGKKQNSRRPDGETERSTD